ncbi:MAG: methyltransferase domain-containing protein [Deltaproteobacteria bacterium]|nr:methyltransferase domain-containing protein [Deltaproteobacteria bacterium]
MKKEREVFGVTYDRYVLMQMHRVMTSELHIHKVVEMPSHGAKAAGSLYSIGFGLAGCHVTLVNPEVEMMYGWHELGMEGQVETHQDIDVYHTPFRDGEFDLAWDFVTWTELEDPLGYLLEMKRIAGQYVFLVTCNNFQPGYPWHRLLHKVYGFPWTHGQVEYNHMGRVRGLFREAGLQVVEYGAIDTPGWPDPSGPRDIRLHRRFGEPTKKPQWEVPIIQYAGTGRFPGWMRLLGKWDMAFRKGVFKLPMSHLFYVLGRKGV